MLLHNNIDILNYLDCGIPLKGMKAILESGLDFDCLKNCNMTNRVCNTENEN